MNFCLVKYIHLKDVNPSVLHTTQDFEFSSAVIGHSSLEEMERKVAEHCPPDFTCFNPIALHHEVLWRTSLREAGNGLVEVDQLFQPIDDIDYMAIQWNRSLDESPMLSTCVHIQRCVDLME